MPCIQTKVSVKMTEQQEKAIKAKLGQAISLIPGKSENWLMLTFEDGCKIYFQGDCDKPAAFVEVKIYGKANGSVYNQDSSHYGYFEARSYRSPQTVSM